MEGGTMQSAPFRLPASREELEATQRERMKIAVERAQASPFHKKRLAGIDPAKAAADPEHWRKIPILDKEELRVLSAEDFYEGFNVAPRSEIWEFWRSGGSTGKPLFYPRTFADRDYCLLSFTRGIQMAGLKKGGLAHVSFPLGIHPVGHMYAKVCQAAGIGVNWAGAGTNTPSAAQVQLIDEMKPTVWMGMSSYGIHLANLAEAQGIDLSKSSVKTIICSAEAISATKREKIERMWGATLYDTFGMTECGLMGGEGTEHDGFVLWSDMFHFEVLDPDTLEPVPEGEVGMLVTTPLWTNHGTPFIRWSAGDLVTHRTEHGNAGPWQVFPVVKHAHRTAGFFKVRGINITHADFEDFMFAIPQVKDFMLEVVPEGDRDELRVSIEVVQDADERALAGELDKRIKEVFELAARIEVLATGTLGAAFEKSIKAPRFVDRRNE